MPAEFVAVPGFRLVIVIVLGTLWTSAESVEDRASHGGPVTATGMAMTNVGFAAVPVSRPANAIAQGLLRINVAFAGVMVPVVLGVTIFGPVISVGRRRLMTVAASTPSE